MRNLLIVMFFACVLAACDCTPKPDEASSSSSEASTSTVEPPISGGSMPAASAITYTGFGPAAWGASEEEVRQAWGREMDGPPSQPDTCSYLFPQPRGEDGYRIGFMMEDAKLSRIDVSSPDIVAPGGGRIGMDEAALRALYPSMTKDVHKYVEGAFYLRVTDPQGGNGALVFETDETRKVTTWRVGAPPQVDYVEGCG